LTKATRTAGGDQAPLARRLGFALFRAGAAAIQALPKPFAYVVSDIFAAVLEYPLGYRKKVIRDNLRRALPDKSDEDILRLARRFYHHLADVAVEIIKSQGLRAGGFRRYVRIRNLDLVAGWLRKYKTVFILAGHYGNWEFLNVLPPLLNVKSLAVYLPPKNPHFDRYLRRGRSRFGAEAVRPDGFFRRLREWQKQGLPTLSLILADQSPAPDKVDLWIRFLNQETGCSAGWEKIARKARAAVVYLDIRKCARGLYEYDFKVMSEKAEAEAPYRLVRDYQARLEKSIARDPAYWLWSHRRWKLRPPSQSL